MRDEQTQQGVLCGKRKEVVIGHYILLGHCICCGRLFGFHPDRVPSLRVYGIREPVCLDCIHRVNPLRKANGLPEIVPLLGAYEPQAENEVFLED